MQLSDKIFEAEFSPDFYVKRSHEYKKVVFENGSGRMYVTLWGEYSSVYASKTKNQNNTKFYARYQIGE